MKKTTSFIKY